MAGVMGSLEIQGLHPMVPQMATGRWEIAGFSADRGTSVQRYLTGRQHRRQHRWNFHSATDFIGRFDAFIAFSRWCALIAERSGHIHRMQYRRGEYILNRLRAQIAINKVVILTYRGVNYEKQL